MVKRVVMQIWGELRNIAPSLFFLIFWRRKKLKCWFWVWWECQMCSDFFLWYELRALVQILCCTSALIILTLLVRTSHLPKPLKPQSWPYRRELCPDSFDISSLSPKIGVIRMENNSFRQGISLLRPQILKSPFSGFRKSPQISNLPFHAWVV